MGDRVRAARAAGFGSGEFHLWRDKNIDSVAAALAETGVTLAAICADPRRSLVDPAQHDEVLQAVRESLVAAKAMGSAPLILASGFSRDGVSDADHFAAAVSVLRQAAALAQEAGIMLLLEPLNSKIDHPGMYLVSTGLGLDLVEAVNSPHLRLLYDVYHSTVMGEDMEQVLTGRMHLVHHVQVADFPGRNEPGTGTIDWPATMATLARLGYDGGIGLEYRPTLPIQESLALTRRTLGL
jgi:hydroxypyruvate isomerase